MKVFLMFLQYMSNKIILDLFQLFVILNRPKISVSNNICCRTNICPNVWAVHSESNMWQLLNSVETNKQTKTNKREIQISDCMSTTKRSRNKVTGSDGREFKNDSPMVWIYLCCIVFHSLWVKQGIHVL